MTARNLRSGYFGDVSLGWLRPCSVTDHLGLRGNDGLGLRGRGRFRRSA